MMPDFNSHRFNDTVFPNPQTGDNIIRSIVTSQGKTGFSRIISSPSTPTEYRLELRGDFNNDNHPDSLWRNYETGDTIVGLMKGDRIVGGTLLPGSDPAWQPRVLGDFTGDGQIDIVWRHAESGDMYIAEMDRSQITQYIGLQTSLPEWKLYPEGLEWQLFPAGDVDGNGTEDLRWCNTQTEENTIWRMEGSAILEEVVLPNGLCRELSVAGVEDIDFPRLTRNFLTPDKTVVQVDRSNLIGSRILPSLISDSSWELNSSNNFVLPTRHLEVLSQVSGSNLTNGSLENEALYGNLGNDTLKGGDGDDRIFGGSDNDLLAGGIGNDFLSGDAGIDTLLGGLYSGLYASSEEYYRDWMFQDTLTGGTGSDTFVLRTIDHQSTPPSLNTVEIYYTIPPLPTPDNADRITDFEDGIDRLLLPDRIAFEHLSFAPIGDRGESTFIYAPYLRFSTGIPGYSATIAVLENVAVSQISPDDFVTDSHEFLISL